MNDACSGGSRSPVSVQKSFQYFIQWLQSSNLSMIKKLINKNWKNKYSRLGIKLVLILTVKPIQAIAIALKLNIFKCIWARMQSYPWQNCCENGKMYQNCSCQFRHFVPGQNCSEGSMNIAIRRHNKSDEKNAHFFLQNCSNLHERCGMF